MTERLYYNPSHKLDFTAQVTAVIELEAGRCAIELDRTAFYPTGGGQPTDTGTLATARVIECIEAQDEGVLHIIEGPAPQVGDTVQGRVDEARRRDHMQQHTGQHILSQSFISLFQAETRGFRMFEEVSEIDIALDNPTDARIETAVDLANEIIWENRAINALQVTPEEAARLPLRKDSGRAGVLRLIEIDRFDLTPCGGTHARHTGTVGLIAVRSWSRAKGLTRLEFLAGERALTDYRRANGTARHVAALFSVGRDDTPEAIVRLREEGKQLQRRLRELETIAARVEAAQIVKETAPRSDGLRMVVRVEPTRDAEYLKALALALAAEPQVVALLATPDKNDSIKLVFARSANVPGDMNALMRNICTQLNGRGGGRSDFAQGGGRHTPELAALLLQQAEKV